MATHVLTISISLSELALATTALSSSAIQVQVHYQDDSAETAAPSDCGASGLALPGAAHTAPNDNTLTGANRLIVYWCGCDGLLNLAARLGHPQMKIGSLVASSLDNRFAGLGACRYGAAFRDPADPTSFLCEPGFDAWRTVENRPADFDRIPLPEGTAIENGVFVIHLPDGVDPWAVDGYMRTLLATREIHVWARSTEGRAACARAAINPDMLSRYSCDPKTGAFTPTTEIYSWHPRRDREFFVSVLREAIAWASRRAAA